MSGIVSQMQEQASSRFIHSQQNSQMPHHLNSCSEWCKKNRIESHNPLVPCTAREFKSMYGTDSLVDLFSTVSNNLVKYQKKQTPLTSEELKQLEIDQIVMKVMKVIAEPSSSALGVVFSSKLEHALHNLEKTFIGFGSNDSMALGFDSKNWSDFISGHEISTFIKEASKSQPQSFIKSNQEFQEADEDVPDGRHKIFSTVGIDSNIDFLALGHDFTFFMYDCGCMGLAGTWSESFARLFKYQWSRELAVVSPSMFCTIMLSSRFYNCFSKLFTKIGKKIEFRG